jgi:hypothetical protein
VNFLKVQHCTAIPKPAAVIGSPSIGAPSERIASKPEATGILLKSHLRIMVRRFTLIAEDPLAKNFRAAISGSTPHAGGGMFRVKP